MLDFTATYDPDADAATITFAGSDFSYLLQLAAFEVGAGKKLV